MKNKGNNGLRKKSKHDLTHKLKNDEDKEDLNQDQDNSNKSHTNQSRYIFNPDNFFRLTFDITGFILIIYQTITVPFSICFNFNTEAFTVLDYFSDIFFIIDIFINFNTGYYNEGVLVMNRGQICMNYIKGWLGFDIISSFPYSFIFDNLEMEISLTAKNAPKLLRIIRVVRFIKILRLLKVAKFRSVFYKLEDTLNSEKVQALYIYLKTMVLFFFVWHFLACIWFAIAMTQYESQYYSIGADSDIAKSSVSTQYLFMLYFTLSTFFTIGYGDIHPVSTYEQIFAIFVMLLSYGLFCFMVSTIRNIVQKMIENDQSLRVKLRNVNKFFSDKHLPKELSNKVSKYLEFMYSEKETRRLEEVEIFSLLNDKLRNELKIELNKRILLNLKMFKKTEFDLLVNKFCEKVYEEVISPNEVIITEGDLISKRMYFIDKGNVLLYHDATTVVLKELGVRNKIFIFN